MEVKSLISKENLFTTIGRRCRKDYFLISLFWGVIFSIVGAILGLCFIPQKTISMLVSLCSLYPNYCNNVMRLHDLDKDNGWAIVILVCGLCLNISISFIGSMGVSAGLLLVCLVVGLYMLFVKGTTGPNKCGEDPLK